MELVIPWLLFVGYPAMGTVVALRVVQYLYESNHSRYKNIQSKRRSMWEASWQALGLGVIWPITLPVVLMFLKLNGEEMKAQALERAQKIVEEYNREQKEKEESAWNRALSAKPPEKKRRRW